MHSPLHPHPRLGGCRGWHPEVPGKNRPSGQGSEGASLHKKQKPNCSQRLSKGKARSLTSPHQGNQFQFIKSKSYPPLSPLKKTSYPPKNWPGNPAASMEGGGAAGGGQGTAGATLRICTPSRACTGSPRLRGSAFLPHLSSRLEIAYPPHKPRAVQGGAACKGEMHTGAESPRQP